MELKILNCCKEYVFHFAILLEYLVELYTFTPLLITSFRVKNVEKQSQHFLITYCINFSKHAYFGEK